MKKTCIFRTIIALFMLLACLSLCVACADISDGSTEEEKPNTNPDGSAEEGKPNAKPDEIELLLVETGSTRFCIMISESESSKYTVMAQNLQKGIKAVSGAELELKTDSDTDDQDNADAYEILIGNTKRPESESAMAELSGEHEYLIRISGRKIIIVGNSDNAVAKAIVDFLSTMCGYRSAEDFDTSSTISLKQGNHRGEWSGQDVLPGDEEPEVLYGLTQTQIDEYFGNILNGIFTGDTIETITTTNIGANFDFHFPDIVYVDGKYMAYYITYKTKTGKGGVGLAVSDNGKTWTDKGCVLQPSEDWDCNGAYFAGVWVDTDGKFYLTYECKGGENTEYGTLENVALAVSEDGYTWEKEGVIIYADHDSWWQRANVGTPDLYKQGETWYVFFHGFDYIDCRLGVAYGKDLHDLTILPEPIINTEDNTLWSGTVGRRDVIYCDGYYYMVYEISTDQVNGNFGGSQWSHMFARSKDLITWEIADGPLLTQSATGFGYDGPCWVIVGNRLYVYMRQGGNTTAVELKLAY